MTDAFGLSPAAREPRGRDSAMYDAAANLVAKAVTALADGQTDTAVAYVRRAQRLPYDDSGGAAPLALAAHMRVMQVVLDVYERGGGLWVAAADVLRRPQKTWEPLAMADFRHVLTVVQHNYATTTEESRGLRALIRGHRVATVREMQGLAGEQLSAVAISLLQIAAAYQRMADVIAAERDADQ